MGGRRLGDDEGSEGGRPVEPGEAREHGNDPDAVTIHRRDGASGERDAEERASTGRRDGGEREGDGGREEAGEGSSGSMEKTDKVLISALAIVGVVLLAVLFALSLLRTPEWVQFVLALALFAALGLGAYRYVITPSGRSQEGGSD